jgi:ketosteroid isomerase-like protein
MTATTSPALQTALAYFRAWTSRDIDQAMTYIAGDIVCQAPSGRLEGAEAFRGFMGPFMQILTKSSLIAAFGDEEQAVVMYDTDTVPVKDAPGAECVTVKDGKITHMRIISTSFPSNRRARPPRLDPATPEPLNAGPPVPDLTSWGRHSRSQKGTGILDRTVSALTAT